MKRVSFIRIMGLVLGIILLTIICSAADKDGYVVYVQGGTGTLTYDTDGTETLQISDLVPFYSTFSEGKSNLIPVPLLTGFSLPLHAAIVITGPEGDSTSLIRIVNWSLSDNMTSIDLEWKPVEFYDGTLLVPFDTEKKEITQEILDGSIMTGLYLEISGETPSNDASPSSQECLQIKKICEGCATKYSGEKFCTGANVMCPQKLSECQLNPTN